jgi:hypothetical protein
MGDEGRVEASGRVEEEGIKRVLKGALRRLEEKERGVKG